MNSQHFTGKFDSQITLPVNSMQ